MSGWGINEQRRPFSEIENRNIAEVSLFVDFLPWHLEGKAEVVYGDS
jgi:hypothetical protein